MTKMIYNYSAQTGEFINAVAADESPLEPGVILLPAHATAVKPPATAAHQVAVFEGEQWALKADWRGVTLTSTSTGQPVNITEIGTTPADVGATETPRPSPAHVWGADGWTLDHALAAMLDAQSKAAQIQAVATQVQAHLDAQAVALGYDNIFTAVTYATEPAVPKFQNDGIALRAWRSLVWAKCYEVLAEIDAGTREPLDAAQLLALLPTFSQEQA